VDFSKKIQKFSNQKSGQKGANIKKILAILKHLTGDDEVNFLKYYFLSTNQGKTVLEELKEVIFEKKIKEIFLNIQKAHQNAPQNEKQRFLSLISHFSKAELEKYGVSFSYSSLNTASNYRNNYKFGESYNVKRPDCKQVLPSETIEKIHNFFYNDRISTNSSYLSIIKKFPNNKKESIPVRILETSYINCYTQ